MYNKNNKNRSLQQYAEIPKQYAEMPKQKHPKQKHAGGYEQRPSKSKRTLCLRKVKLKDDFN